MPPTKLVHWLHFKIKNTKTYYHDNGFRSSLFHCFVRILENVGVTFQKKILIFYELDLEGRSFDVSSFSDLDFRQYQSSDLDPINDYHDGWFDQGKALQRINAGHQLFVVQEQGHPVYFHWIECHQTTIPSIDLYSIALPEQTVCLAYIYTEPAYRGRGYASKAIPLVLHHLQEHGQRHVFLVVASDNPTSQHVFKKLGFHEYQIVSYRKMFFRNTPFLRSHFIKDWNSRRTQHLFHCSKTTRKPIWNTYSKLTST